MKRDCARFPDDENGDVLWQMLQNGDDLSKARGIDFSLIFPTEDHALQFAIYLLRDGQRVSFSEYKEHDELPWQVHVHRFMEPTHESITDFENRLGEAAVEFRGRNDGWGSMAQD